MGKGRSDGGRKSPLTFLEVPSKRLLLRGAVVLGVGLLLILVALLEVGGSDGWVGDLFAGLLAVGGITLGVLGFFLYILPYLLPER